MNILKTIAAAFSMFSAIPMPQFEWDKGIMRNLLAAFPLIGAAIGVACWLWEGLGSMLAFPPLLQGAVLCLIPVWLTGGIHLDGYADTCDALASHREPARKQEILKDPHVGSFAVLRLCGWFVLTWALWSALPVYRPGLILSGFCLSRLLSALAITVFPMAKDTGLAHTFAENTDKVRMRAFLLTGTVLVSVLMYLGGVEGIAMTGSAFAVFGYYYRMSRIEFGGISGDLAGWFLIQAEKWMLTALVVTEYTGVLLTK